MAICAREGWRVYYLGGKPGVAALAAEMLREQFPGLQIETRHGYFDQHSDAENTAIVNAINDCHAVLVSKIGACPRDELKGAGIEPVDAYADEFIEKAALSWFADYTGRVARGEIAHAERGDASIRQGAFTAAA